MTHTNDDNSHTASAQDDTPNLIRPRNQVERMASGCQAIFAGFVAVAHLQQIRPCIRAFWDTPQREMIAATLCSIKDEGGDDGRVNDEGGRHAEGAERTEGEDDCQGQMRVLWDVLNRSDNKFTKLVPGAADASVSVSLSATVQTQTANANNNALIGHHAGGIGKQVELESRAKLPLLHSPIVCPTTPASPIESPIPSTINHIQSTRGIEPMGDRSSDDYDWKTREWKLTGKGAKLFSISAMTHAQAQAQAQSQSQAYGHAQVRGEAQGRGTGQSDDERVELDGWRGVRGDAANTVNSSAGSVASRWWDM